MLSNLPFLGVALWGFFKIAARRSTLSMRFAAPAGYFSGVLQGDLRLYGLVQFASLLATPIILWRFPKNPGILKWAVLGFLLYVFAKVLEVYDHSIKSLLFLSGGHPLKHLAAAWATYCIGRFMFEEIRAESKNSIQISAFAPSLRVLAPLSRQNIFIFKKSSIP